MAGICLVNKAIWSQSQTAIKDANLVGSVKAFAYTPSDLQFEVFGKLSFVVIQILGGTQGCEVITMNNDIDVEQRVMETAW